MYRLKFAEFLHYKSLSTATKKVSSDFPTRKLATVSQQYFTFVNLDSFQKLTKYPFNRILFFAKIFKFVHGLTDFRKLTLKPFQQKSQLRGFRT